MSGDKKTRAEKIRETREQVEKKLDPANPLDNALLVILEGESYEAEAYPDPAELRNPNNKKVTTVGIGFTMNKTVRNKKTGEWVEKLEPQARERWEKAKAKYAITEDFDAVKNKTQSLSLDSALALNRVVAEEGLEFWKGKIKNFEELGDNKKTRPAYIACLDLFHQFGREHLENDEPLKSVTNALAKGDCDKASRLLAATKPGTGEKSWLWWGDGARMQRNLEWLATGDNVALTPLVEDVKPTQKRTWEVKKREGDYSYQRMENVLGDDSHVPIFKNSLTGQQCAAYPTNMIPEKFSAYARCDGVTILNDAGVDVKKIDPPLLTPASTLPRPRNTPSLN